MTSPYERPDREALTALTPLVQGLVAELEGWRRRAHAAEAALQAAQTRPAAPVGTPPASPADLERLEREAAELRGRLARAREQVDLLRTRLRFLEERGEGAA